MKFWRDFTKIALNLREIDKFSLINLLFIDEFVFVDKLIFINKFCSTDEFFVFDLFAFFDFYIFICLCLLKVHLQTNFKKMRDFSSL